ncbi:MAG: protease complex subunit PrcB family protein [Synechococcaceae cyanobacterium SM1_2_3]|nr:protease complex subunit PrcB family protein [Synechococcaceae cyanobacterium SM1_2_3]
MNPPAPPPVDFPREGVLLLAMGQRPSAGYGLSLIGNTVAIQDGVLTVQVAWREPLPGYRQAQMISNPCLLLKLPEANFSRFQVRDQDGQVRLEGGR